MVKRAIEIIDDALEDPDFQKWIDKNRDSLEYEYDEYVSACHESFEEPDSFYMFALWRYLNDETI